MNIRPERAYPFGQLGSIGKPQSASVFEVSTLRDPMLLACSSPNSESDIMRTRPVHRNKKYLAGS